MFAMVVKSDEISLGRRRGYQGNGMFAFLRDTDFEAISIL